MVLEFGKGCIAGIEQRAKVCENHRNDRYPSHWFLRPHASDTRVS